ncbi:hypothetical protein [Pediococcus acidilactici]|uniref:hypothetical protein n=1 Tax=Pediococcus acidilactici TaxID=1254 RepID=UPI0013120606|nr:hypothetical protein [Pediococcus acidilactici]KAF0342095.1 hypothetical protein GBO42_00745 [Pediococcus acidilactici]KAF0353950.1 hypothetical protein GBO46_00745 [Pediococcus acidilactici]KAF0357614.1 hypothetical protein GBO48_00745 [Pediococcus acidilactici]KAF0376471.1 hypothetical protein GBO57_00800 [Pediococcus acidilactici]KAF0377532.1 hypothetical protein GBO59_00745 [Pediococcus acidilactici]
MKMNDDYKLGYENGQIDMLLELGNKLRAMSEPLFQKLIKEQKLSADEDVRLTVLNEIGDWEKQMVEDVTDD